MYKVCNVLQISRILEFKIGKKMGTFFNKEATKDILCVLHALALLIALLSRESKLELSDTTPLRSHQSDATLFTGGVFPFNHWNGIVSLHVITKAKIFVKRIT